MKVGVPAAKLGTSPVSISINSNLHERGNVKTNSNIRIVIWEKIIGVNQLGSMSQRARHKNSKSEKSSVFLFVPYFSLMPENLT